MDKELVWDFFVTFSRFEYALKASGKYRRRGKDAAAEADWEKFAKDLGRLEKAELNPVLKRGAYLIENPPRKQVINSAGSLDWAEAEPNGAEIRKLLIYIRRVRNNLFHGGKAHRGSERDRDLIDASRSVLKAILEIKGLNPALKKYYHGA